VNLHGIVAGAIGAVNPQVGATLRRSTGYSTAADGTRIPLYETFANVTCQVQELTQRDLAQVEGIVNQGSSRAVYLNGRWRGAIRVAAVGGDILQLADGTVWLVTAVPEQWPDWTKLIVTLQDGS
jgi:hypothetical protein